MFMNHRIQLKRSHSLMVIILATVQDKFDQNFAADDLHIVNSKSIELDRIRGCGF